MQMAARHFAINNHQSKPSVPMLGCGLCNSRSSSILRTIVAMAPPVATMTANTFEEDANMKKTISIHKHITEKRLKPSGTRALSPLS